MIESELELMKIASIVVAYVVHKAMLNECKNIFILVSRGKVKTKIRLMRYLSEKKQMTILRIMAYIMILGDWEFSKVGEVVSLIQQVDRLWFYL